jgi:hypothetical protein
MRKASMSDATVIVEVFDHPAESGTCTSGG